MPIADRSFKKLTPENVARAPRKPGVYALYAQSRLVFLGSASGEETLRTALQSHLQAPPSKATRYKREPSRQAAKRLKALLAEQRSETRGDAAASE